MGELNIITADLLGEDLKSEIGETLAFMLFSKGIKKTAPEAELKQALGEESVKEEVYGKVSEYYDFIEGEKKISISVDDLYNLYVEYSI